MYNGNCPAPMGIRRKSFLSVGLAWRIPLALLISFLIMLAFFATSASSH